MSAPSPGYSISRTAYCASKGAVNLLTRVMALELGPMGIRVNVVAPGVMSTGAVVSNLTKAGMLEETSRYIPARRLGMTAEVAQVVRFLASDDASYVHGSVIVVDGGVTARQAFPLR